MNFGVTPAKSGFWQIVKVAQDGDIYVLGHGLRDASLLGVCVSAIPNGIRP